MPHAKNSTHVNKHGLNMTFFNVKIRTMMLNMRYYKAKELARDLAKLAYAADPQVAVTTTEHLQTEETCNG